MPYLLLSDSGWTKGLKFVKTVFTYRTTLTLLYYLFKGAPYFSLKLCGRMDENLNMLLSIVQILGEVLLSYRWTRSGGEQLAVLNSSVGAVVARGHVDLWAEAGGLGETPLATRGPSAVVHQTGVYGLTHHRLLLEPEAVSLVSAQQFRCSLKSTVKAYTVEALRGF